MLSKKTLKIALTFLGTFIGAGFASGKEIALFFGETGWFSPLIAGVICGFLAFVFLELSRTTKNNLLQEIFPQTHRIWKGFISFSGFIMFSAMLAASEYVVFTSFGYTGGGLLSGIIALAVVSGGGERLASMNAIVVPLLILLIIIFYLIEPSFDISGKFSLSAPLLYASMNILSGGILVSKISGGNISSKESKQIALIVGGCLSLLITLVYLSVRKNLDAEMPILVTAQKYNITAVGSLLIYLSVLTSMVSSLSLASSQNNTAFFAVGGGFLVSLIGFSNIVNIAYPIIGGGGAILSIFAIINLVVRQKQDKMPCKSKKVKNAFLSY